MTGDVDTRKSTYHYISTLAGGVILWCSRLQRIIALSATGAEYISAAEASKEAIWFTPLCSEVESQSKFQSYIVITKVPYVWQRALLNHARTKHIDTHYHFIREVIEDGQIQLVKIDTTRIQ